MNNINNPINIRIEFQDHVEYVNIDDNLAEIYKTKFVVNDIFLNKNELKKIEHKKNNEIIDDKKIDKIISKLKFANEELKNSSLEIKEIRSFFIKNPQCMDFILNNYLHYRIDDSYLDRGISPKIVKDSQGQLRLFFPINNGKVEEPKIDWIEWNQIPLEKGKIKGWTYGPFGFENYAEDKFLSLRPIKIIPRPQQESATPRIELVSSYPQNGFNPLAWYGHSWIRFKIPILDKEGKDTNQDWIYSIGYRLQPLHSTLNTPDIHEFLDRPKVYTTVSIDMEKFEEIKVLIEQIQAKINGIEISDQKVIDLAYQIQYGTCANFATLMFNKAVSEEFQIGDVRSDVIQMVFSTSISNYIADVSKPFSKYPLLNHGVRLINLITQGIMPSSNLIQTQESVLKTNAKQ